MNEMAAARFNVFWYLSLVFPALIMLLSAYLRRRSIFIVGIIFSLMSTYILSTMAVEEKWRIRNQIAQTEHDREYAQADGANLVFTALIFAPLEAVIYTTIWGLMGFSIWPRKKK